MYTFIVDYKVKIASVFKRILVNKIINISKN